MQISTSNFLIAAQQAAKTVLQAHATAKPAFEPLEFKQTAAPAKTAAQGTPVSRPGSQLDITV
jgi:hypothetical protein